MIKSKTCFLIPSVSSGGIEMYVLRLLKYLREVSNITIIVRSHQKGDLYEDYKATGVKLVFMPLGYMNPKKLKQHYQFYKQEQFDVICDFNANFAGWVVWLAKQAGVSKRMAFYRQGRDHFKPTLPNKMVNKLMNRLVYKNATHILSNSNAAIEFFFSYKKQNDKRFQVIYNGINSKDYQLVESKEDIRHSLKLPLDKYIIGHVGRLDPAKNHTTILKTFRNITKEQDNVHLVLCGRDTEQLQDQIHELGIENHTSLLGYRNDVPRVLKALDVFFFPSLTEGQPNALIEAMVSGLPIVASDIQPIKEIVPVAYRDNLKPALDIQAFRHQLIKLMHTQIDNTKTRNQVISEFDHGIKFEEFEAILNEK